MSKRPSPPSHRAIAEYWEVGEHALHCDIGEPCCWACGRYRPGKYADTVRAYEDAAWLERAHLVAHAAGGANTADNYALLCHDCHKDMDRELGENTDRDLALDWIRNWRNRFCAAFIAAVEPLDIDPSEKLTRALAGELTSDDCRSVVRSVSVLKRVAAKEAA